MEEQNIILKVLVGSRAHKMARPDSDYDFRCVFVSPTRDILSLSNAGQKTLWKEGETKFEDDLTGWEIGHFLKLAHACNPTILEVFGARQVQLSPVRPKFNRLGGELQRLLPHIINPKRVWDAFNGYSRNQWKKLDADKYDNQGSVATWTKFGIAAARVLMQGRYLLSTGDMLVPLPDEDVAKLSALRDRLQDDNNMTKGQLLDYLERLRFGFWQAYEDNRERFVPDAVPVNDFLLKVRDEFWVR